MIQTPCEPWAHRLELLQTISGVGVKVAQVFIAETGGFPSAAPFGRVGRFGNSHPARLGGRHRRYG